jgi:ABC-type transport system involved in multi-copper enzyme maturation permease subunit
MTRATTLGTTAAARVMAGIEFKRLLRRRGLWVTGGIAWLPALIPLIEQNRRAWLDLPGATVAAMAVCAPLMVASLVADDIQNKTSSYLFTRPPRRRGIFLGKLAAALPALVLLMCLPVVVSFLVSVNAPMSVLHELGNTLFGVAAGALATGTVAGAWGAVFPRRALPAAVGYLFLFDTGLAIIPFSINNLSMTRHAVKLAEGANPVVPLLWLAALTGIWLAVGMWRFERA